MEYPSNEELEIRVKDLEDRLNAIYDILSKIGIKDLAGVVDWFKLVKQEFDKQPLYTGPKPEPEPVKVD